MDAKTLYNWLQQLSPDVQVVFRLDGEELSVREAYELRSLQGYVIELERKGS
jgi:hypothetical protein